MRTITIGVDLAKLLFSICEVDPSGRVLQRKDLRRDAFAAWLAQLPAGTIVAMEACSGAHHWARRCLALGLVPKLMANTRDNCGRCWRARNAMTPMPAPNTRWRSARSRQTCYLLTQKRIHLFNARAKR